MSRSKKSAAADERAISLYVSKAQHAELWAAAGLTQKRMAEFVKDAALEAAKKILEKRGK